MVWDKGLDKTSAAYKLASSDARVVRSVAGPGSGKTFAIKRRIVHLLEKGIEPEKILVITFTRTSASDLRSEIMSIGVEGCEKVVAKTIHSHALLILHRSEIRTIISREPRIVIDHEIDPALRDIDFPQDKDIKERRKMLETYQAAWANLQNEDPGLPRDEVEEEFTERITGWLEYHQGMMIGEVIPIALRYLQNNPASPEIGKHDFILVDEYQDLNRAEQEFIRLLSGSKNIVIVGDDDQSIYGFKYAHPEGIRQIRNFYGDYDDIIFNTIRRCPKYVTRLASALISKNRNRTLGELVPYEQNQEGNVQIAQWPNSDQEIDGVVQIIKKEINSKLLNPEDILVLSPRRLFGYKIRDTLRSNGIPAKSFFREDIIKNKKVQRAYSLLYLLAFPKDKISLRFLLGCKSQNFKYTQYKRLRDYSEANELTIRDALNAVLLNKIRITGISWLIKDYGEILNDLAILRRRLLEDPENIFDYFSSSEDDGVEFDEIISLYRDILSNNPCENKDDEEYISGWIKRIISKVAESISLPDSPENIEQVRIMSLHSSKGLSAKFVIMVSMIDELMPFIGNNDNRTRQQIIEEQRRLFYVAMTRCKSSEKDYQGKLIISSFIWLDETTAKRIKLKVGNGRQRQMQVTRFLDDFGRIKPRTILGRNLI
jgi:superfamily I DNA/RNA helicase